MRAHGGWCGGAVGDVVVSNVARCRTARGAQIFRAASYGDIFRASPPSPRVLIISLISISGRSRAIFLEFIFLIGTIVSVVLKFCSLALETLFLLSRTAVFLSFLFLLK